MALRYSLRCRYSNLFRCWPIGRLTAAGCFRRRHSLSQYLCRDCLPATGTALFFLRPYPLVWRIFVTGALAVTMTGLAVWSSFWRPKIRPRVPFSDHVDVITAPNSAGSALCDRFLSLCFVRADPLHSSSIFWRRCHRNSLRIGCFHLVPSTLVIIAFSSEIWRGGRRLCCLGSRPGEA